MDGSVRNLRFLPAPSVVSFIFSPIYTPNPPTADSLLASPLGDANSESVGGLTRTAPLPSTPTYLHPLIPLSSPLPTTYSQLSSPTKHRNATSLTAFITIIYSLLFIISNHLIYVTCLYSLCSICYFYFRRSHFHLRAMALSSPPPTLTVRVLAPAAALVPLLKEEKTDFKLYTQWPMIYGAETKTFPLQIPVTADQEARISSIFKSCNKT